MQLISRNHGSDRAHDDALCTGFRFRLACRGPGARGGEDRRVAADRAIPAGFGERRDVSPSGSASGSASERPEGVLDVSTAAGIDLLAAGRRAGADDAARQPRAGRVPHGCLASDRGCGHSGSQSAASRRGGRRQVPDALAARARRASRFPQRGPENRRPRRSKSSRHSGATWSSSRSSDRKDAA